MFEKYTKQLSIGFLTKCISPDFLNMTESCIRPDALGQQLCFQLFFQYQCLFLTNFFFKLTNHEEVLWFNHWKKNAQNFLRLHIIAFNGSRELILGKQGSGFHLKDPEVSKFFYKKNLNSRDSVFVNMSFPFMLI